MLKPLLFVLAIVTLLAIALNFDYFLETKKEQPKAHQSIQKELLPTISAKNEIEQTSTIKTVNSDANLSKELKALLNQADKLFRESKDAEAHLLYDKVIEKSKNSHNVEILKLFAQACFSKATLYYIYPNYDVESALELYDVVIDKFEKSSEKELILHYMEAKIKQTQFRTKEENLISYDETIERLKRDPQQRFESEIEALLFSKSFLLMGYDDEEAMEILDDIIEKYDPTQPLPDTVKYSIFNNIELAIITNNNTEEYIDLADEYMKNSPDTKPLIGMLTIIKNAQDLPQDEELKRWQENYKDYKLSDWDFSELRKWVNKMEYPESQIRISQYLDIFEQHKYNSYTQSPSVPLTPYVSSKDSNETTGNENEGVVYEPDPYLNDIYTSQNALNDETSNLTYPDPYATDEGIVYEAPPTGDYISAEETPLHD